MSVTRIDITVHRADDETRWTAREARSGKVIAASSEGYRRRAAALHNIQTVFGIQLVGLTGWAPLPRAFDVARKRWTRSNEIGNAVPQLDAIIRVHTGAAS